MFEAIDSYIETQKNTYTSDTAVMHSLAEMQAHGLTDIGLLEYYTGEAGEIVGFQIELVAAHEGQSYSRIEDMVFAENTTAWALAVG